MAAGLIFMLMTALAPHTAAVARDCTVVDGVVADVSHGPYLPVADTVTLKANYKAEFRWEMSDKESMGWMRIVDDGGREIGWVPAGHEGIRCGENH